MPLPTALPILPPRCWSAPIKTTRGSAWPESGQADDDVFEIYTDVPSFSEARKTLEEKGLTFLQAEITMIPQSKISLDPDKLETFRKMIDKLDENDDVQDIYHNVDLPDDEEEE